MNRRAVFLVAAVLLGACSSSSKGAESSATVSVTAEAATGTAVTAAATVAGSSMSTDVPTTEPLTTAVATADSPIHFETLPVGAALPSDAECAARVRPTEEIRPENAEYNSVRGEGPPQTAEYYSRVTGDFTGTTDEIIQWAACKWGIDEDIVRAQTAKESGWFQQNRGDFTSDPALCVPGHGIGVDGRPGECPESIGLMQLRFQFMTPSFPMATDSSAYNLDAALAARRSCFEGNEPWLNTVDRGQEYAAGDLWGCIGTWFAGRWHTGDADTYAAAVQDYLDNRVWEDPEFLGWTPG